MNLVSLDFDRRRTRFVVAYLPTACQRRLLARRPSGIAHFLLRRFRKELPLSAKGRKHPTRLQQSLDKRAKDYSLAAVGLGAVAFVPAASAAVVMANLNQQVRQARAFQLPSADTL